MIIVPLPEPEQTQGLALGRLVRDLVAPLCTNASANCPASHSPDSSRTGGRRTAQVAKELRVVILLGHVVQHHQHTVARGADRLRKRCQQEGKERKKKSPHGGKKG
jgi:hypothetical protein